MDMSLAPLRHLAQAFARYIVAGGVAFCLDYALLILCYQFLGLHYLLAAAAGFIGGLLCTYLCCNYWVFSRRKLKAQPLREMGLFVLIGLIGLGLTLLLMGLFVGIVGWHPYIAKILTTGLELLWNFTARKLVLY